MRYPVVLFDIGDTLIGPRRSYGAVYSAVLGEWDINVPAEVLDRGIRDTTAEMKSLVPVGRDRFAHFPGGETGFWLRFLRTVLRKSTGRDPGSDRSRSILDRLRESFGGADAWTVYDDVVPTLRALQVDGCRLAVVSNWDSRLPAVLRRLDLAGFFETIGVSHLEGVEKPDPLFFRRVLGRMNAAPAQALHVGNTPELDLEGARAAGIDGMLVDRRPGATASAPAVADLWGLPRVARRGIDGERV